MVGIEFLDPIHTTILCDTNYQKIAPLLKEPSISSEHVDLLCKTSNILYRIWSMMLLSQQIVVTAQIS
jgi:hypothetical protein